MLQRLITNGQLFKVFFCLIWKSDFSYRRGHGDNQFPQSFRTLSNRRCLNLREMWTFAFERPAAQTVSLQTRIARAQASEHHKSQPEASARDTDWMSPCPYKRESQASEHRKSQPEASARDTDWMSPCPYKRESQASEHRKSQPEASARDTDWMSHRPYKRESQASEHRKHNPKRQRGTPQDSLLCTPRSRVGL